MRHDRKRSQEGLVGGGYITHEEDQAIFDTLDKWELRFLAMKAEVAQKAGIPYEE